MDLRKLLMSFKNVLLGIGCILIFFALIKLIVTTNKLLSDNDYAFFFGLSFHKLDNDNIRSIYNKNDLLIIKKSEYYNINDYVVFKDNGNYNVAKISDFTANYYFLTDDTLSLSNNYGVYENNIVGKAVFSIPYFAIFYNIITSWPLIIIGIIFIISYTYLTLSEDKHYFN